MVAQLSNIVIAIEANCKELPAKEWWLVVLGTLTSDRCSMDPGEVYTGIRYIYIYAGTEMRHRGQDFVMV